jgi:hypothetical protein
MKAHYTLISMGIVFLTLFALSVLPHTTVSIRPDSNLAVAQDEIRPNIWGWGIVGNPENFTPFAVWANVSDADSGIKNVTLRVSGPNATMNTAMTYNVTSDLYEKDVPAFPNDGTFYVYVEAFDNYNNSRTSTITSIEAVSNPPTTINPLITMPLVVVSSLVLIVAVIGFALVYDRRQGLGV